MSDELVKAYRSFNHIFKHLPVDDSLPEILLRVIKLTEKTFHHRQTSILLFDNEKQKFTPFTYKEQHHSCHDRLIINPNKIHFKNICSKKKIIISQHITTSNEYQKYYSLKTINTLNRCYGLPILSSKNKVLGLIYLYSSHNSQITNDEQELLEMAATTCSVSIEKNKREQELKRIALHDSLTNIWNRRAFYHHMNKVMKNIQLKNIYLTMFYIDINKFKIINDRYGHQFGDRVLKKYAEKLQTFSNKTTAVARLGGDEFAVYSEADTLDIANSKTKKILYELQEIMIDDIIITASIGSYCIHARNIKDTNIDSMINNADMCMYNQKHLSHTL